MPGASYQKVYNLTPQRGPARQWLALEEAFGREPVLAPSTSTDNLEPTVDLGPQKGNNRSRNVFAIIVSYYVKVITTIPLCPPANLLKQTLIWISFMEGHLPTLSSDVLSPWYPHVTMSLVFSLKMKANVRTSLKALFNPI